jgi:alanine racemase
MTRPARARIDLGAVRHNLRYARRLAPSARVLAVIKANGYGHGAVVLGKALAGQADAFGVACIEEALELRESGVREPILLMEGVFHPDEIAVADRAGLSLVVHTRQQIDWLTGARPGRALDCWLKMDSGMHRVGFGPDGLGEAWRLLSGSPNVASVVLMTHLARADEPDRPETERQLELFDRATEGIPAGRSTANSAAILAWSPSHRDWVRPGIMLYGASPLGDRHPSAAELRPVMRLESALISIRDLPPGEAVGYGGRFVCERPTRVGVVAVGYADGYPRHAPDGTPVAVSGRRTRLIGRVSMDMLTVDLTGIDDARLGDPVQLWGDRVTANEVAEASGTISYQLFTGVTRRVPRVYEGEG